MNRKGGMRMIKEIKSLSNQEKQKIRDKIIQELIDVGASCNDTLDIAHDIYSVLYIKANNLLSKIEAKQVIDINQSSVDGKYFVDPR